MDLRNGKIIVDACRSWDATNPDPIMEKITNLALTYGFRSVVIDRYAGGWVRSAFENLGLEVETREGLPVVYSNLKSLLVAGRLALPDNRELRGGLENTMAFYGRNNSLSIAHERSGAGHADLSDAVATATWAASTVQEEYERTVIIDLEEEFGPDLDGFGEVSLEF